ncbi:LysR family transcriptional regulator [Luteolibacter pohnpeiensis]|uniref:LysR family transcriptional regulator n=1 Tax=Luteolibacter pohnpeiensis TaxID=454153 RepID=A0A934VV11_9BACT|nr:LysR family transcriptional regulator [Luteolibacter pohnpeiensis]
MELRHLRYFVAVAEDLSFRKAANRLHVSGPALSKQIRNLEEETGVKLLERTTVAVSLTEAGKVFLADARQLLTQSEMAVARALQTQSGQSRALRIGSVGIIATDFLPLTLKKFRDRYPGVEIQFVEMLPLEQLEGLKRGTIDIGFAYGQDALANSGLRSLCVVHSQFGVAVSSQHAWAGRKSVALPEIRDLVIYSIGKEPRSVHQEDVCGFCAREGFTPTNLRRVAGFDSLINLIAADQGISLLPQVLDLKNQGIHIIPLEESSNYDFRMWAAWNHQSRNPAVDYFVHLLEKREPS